MSQAQIKNLTGRVAELEGQLTNLQQTLVNLVATQIQALFTNPVMVDSIAHRVLAAGANAIAHKAAASNERAPELVVLEGYIPGSLRAILNEDGSMSVEQQLKGATNAGGTWESVTADYDEKGITDSFAQLMAAYGAQAGRVYYITDTVTSAHHREKLAKELAANVTAVEAEAEDASNLPPEAVPSLEGICLFLALKSDATKTTSAVFEEGTSIEIIRGGVAAHVPVEEVEIDDVAMIEEAGEKVVYIVTDTALATLVSAEDGVESLSTAHVADGTFHENDVVSLVTKPWNALLEGQVELDGDELSTQVKVFEEVTTMVDGVEVSVPAWKLLNRDIIVVARNGQLVKEVVVSAEVLINTPVEMVQ